MQIDRRHFLQISTASLLFANGMEAAGLARAAVSETGGKVRAEGKNYTWEWSQNDDQWRLLDRKGRVITSGPLQPAVLVQPGDTKDRRCVSGKLATKFLDGNQLAVVYENVNGSAKLSVTLRFDEDMFWVKPVVYESPSADDVVSLHYFAQGSGTEAAPRLESSYLIFPGISTSSAISPIVPPGMGLNLTSWLATAALQDRASGSSGGSRRISSAACTGIQARTISKARCANCFRTPTVAAWQIYRRETCSLKPEAAGTVPSWSCTASFGATHAAPDASNSAPLCAGPPAPTIARLFAIITSDS